MKKSRQTAKRIYRHNTSKRESPTRRGVLRAIAANTNMAVFFRGGTGWKIMRHKK
jgi:hypothetical protein